MNFDFMLHEFEGLEAFFLCFKISMVIMEMVFWLVLENLLYEFQDHSYQAVETFMISRSISRRPKNMIGFVGLCFFFPNW